MKLPSSDRDKTNRRGCSLFAIAIPFIILLFAAISLGWLGKVDRGKITDLPIVGNAS